MATIFSRIIAGELPGSFVYRDELVVAFLDICEFNPGHTLVVPVSEVSSFADLDEKTGGRMFFVAGKIARALRNSGLKCAGVNLLLSDGEVAGQEVPHAHLHVVPRYEGDNIQWHFGGSDPRPSRDELDALAERIKRVVV